MSTFGLGTQWNAIFLPRNSLKIMLGFIALVILLYVLASNNQMKFWSFVNVAPYTMKANVSINLNKSIKNNSQMKTKLKASMSGKNSTAIIAQLCSFMRNWTFCESNNKMKQTMSERRHLYPTCSHSFPIEMDNLFRVSEVNCRNLLFGSQNMFYTQYFTKRKKRTLLSEQLYLNFTTNCELFQRQRGYIMCLLTSEEENFPIAFSMLVYKDVEMVERLLRSIYRPQNYYCIHVDIKSKKQFVKAVSAIANCFENVMIVPERLDVRWGEFSVLEPEIICMEHLWRYSKWKYFINLTGQEFPLKTNWELVQILKAYNGANDVEGTRERANKIRWRTNPPHGITAVKGSVHIAVNRDFVDYVLHNQAAKDLLDWVKTTSFPDETFFSTLNHNPQLGIRGSYKGVPETEPDTSMVKPFLARFKNWGKSLYGYPCAGRFVREICILTTGDLPILGKAKQLFANKFYLHEDPIVIGCLEEMIYNNTRDEFKGDKQFNSTYYSQLGFVRNQVI